MAPIYMAYGSMALFLAILHNVFLLYYVEVFVSVYKIDKTSFWIGEIIFLVWNSINDPLFGWISDHKSLDTNRQLVPGSPEVVLKRIRALTKYGPMFTIGFLSFWFQWASPTIQFVICLCIYDGFLTMVDLNHSALLADLALSAEKRTKLNYYCSIFSALGCISVFLSYSFWDKQNIVSFQTFCCCLSVISLVGFVTSSASLKRQFLEQRHLKDDSVSRSERETSGENTSIELKNFAKQLSSHRNFHWFSLMNIVQVFHCHFNSNFFPLFLDKLLGDAISPQTGALLLGLSFVAPHINNMYFLTLCRKYGVYLVVKWLFYLKLTIGVAMLTVGPRWPIFICIFIASNRVFTEGTCKLLNLVISDLVDEDFVLHKRKQAISALIFGTSALLSKPGQTIAPLLGTWLLAEQTGHSVFQSDQQKPLDPISTQAMQLGCFYVLVYIPIACAILQIIAWSRFTLHGQRLQWVKYTRKGTEHYSTNV